MKQEEGVVKIQDSRKPKWSTSCRAVNPKTTNFRVHIVVCCGISLVTGSTLTFDIHISLTDYTATYGIYWRLAGSTINLRDLLATYGIYRWVSGSTDAFRDPRWTSAIHSRLLMLSIAWFNVHTYLVVFIFNTNDISVQCEVCYSVSQVLLHLVWSWSRRIPISLIWLHDHTQ